ncbi:MAG TPA: ACT domain-containing protein, partial [Woeseiaceae bacterium]
MNKTVIFNRPKPQEESGKIPQLIVLSAVGTDRAGVVNDITRVILDCGGNIEESRMTALGAEFAMLMLISGN